MSRPKPSVRSPKAFSCARSRGVAFCGSPCLYRWPQRARRRQLVAIRVAHVKIPLAPRGVLRPAADQIAALIATGPGRFEYSRCNACRIRVCSSRKDRRGAGEHLQRTEDSECDQTKGVTHFHPRDKKGVVCRAYPWILFWPEILLSPIMRSRFKRIAMQSSARHAARALLVQAVFKPGMVMESIFRYETQNRGPHPSPEAPSHSRMTQLLFGGRNDY